MRRALRDVLLGAALASAASAALVACVDLFHSTNFETLCAVDAAACSPAEAAAPLPDAAPSAFPASFCAWDPATARHNASHACAWLGACAGPVGENAFGPCVLRATLAYDCAANPNRQVNGAAHDFWDRLWRAASCADVLAALLPPNTAAKCGASASAYAACVPGAGSVLSCDVDDAGNASTGGIESCAPLGQTCASSNGLASCAGAASACSAAGTSCDGTRLHDCEPDASPFDQGVDCATFGGGACVPGAGACLAAGDAGCAPSSDVTCDDAGVAVGCPSGIVEQVDCTALFGGQHGGCVAAADGRAWDVSRACTFGAACPSDSCGSDGTTVTSCARGAVFAQSCTSVGLGTCTIDPPTQRAVCVPAGPSDSGSD